MSAPDNGSDDSDVIVPHQAEIQVYANGSGGVTIRSVDHLDEEQIIAFRPSFSEAMIAAIRTAASEARGAPAATPDQSLIDRAFSARTGESRSKLVLVALAFHADPALCVTFSNNRLAEATGLGPLAVAEVISNLEDDGWLSSDLWLDGGHDAPRVYLLTPEAWS